MARKELTVQPREVFGKKVAQLRRAGILPANVYGRGLESQSVQIDAEELALTLKVATANEVLDLKIEGERAARPVVIHHIQRHPLGKGMLHADFYQVSLREKMRADVPIVIVGQSDAVETYNGVLLPGIEALHIEALPLDIPTHLEIDITPLTELDTSLHVRDLDVPANVTVLTDPDVVVVGVSSPRIAVEEEEAAAAAEEEEAAAPEAVAEGEGAEATEEAEPTAENPSA
jgi:large subunit ribosomal protein L25